MKARLLFILIFGSIVSVQGQISNSSLYSRFGLGEIHEGTSVKQRGMAGLGYGLAEPYTLNLKNPASLAFTREPAFSLGLKYESIKASNVDQDQRNKVSVFDHFAMSVPTRNRNGGLALGFIPYSTSGYEYSDLLNVDGTDQEANIIYNGEGGINTMFLKGGYKFMTKEDTSQFNEHDYLSLGAGFKYHFGSLTNSRRLEYPDGTGFINSFIADRTTYNDISLDYGVMYQTYLKRKKEVKDTSIVFNFGASYQPSVKLNGDKSDDVFTYLNSSFGEQVVIDSISALRDQEGFVQLPSGYGVGFSFVVLKQVKDVAGKNRNTNLRRKIVFGADYSANKWSDFQTNFIDVEEFSEITDNSNLTFGLSYLPNVGLSTKSSTSYFQICTYRFGLRSSKLNLNLNNEQITEAGINIGMSLPLVYSLGSRYSSSNLDLSVGYGSRGTIENDLIKEDYLRIMVGLSLRPNFRDQWFKKRKYD